MMDDILTFAADGPGTPDEAGPPWKILICDDEPSVHMVTRLALGEFRFEGRRLELLSAYGEADARILLEQHPDMALVLLDVVMESNDSGFSLVRFIRGTLGNKDVRIIMRTGQSGGAPEDRVIIDYDINDFKDKTELTVAKLRTTLISSLRTYSHLKIIAEEQRRSAASRLYLRSVLDTLDSALISVNAVGTVLLWNRQAQRRSGLEAGAVVGRSLADAAPDLASLQPLIAAQGGAATEARLTLWGQAARVSLRTLPGADGPEILIRIDTV